MLNRGSRFIPVFFSLVIALLFLFTGPILNKDALLKADDDGGTIGLSYKEDINKDGKTNIVDVIAFLLMAMDNPDNPEMDYNGDGSYTVADAILLCINIMEKNLTPAELYSVSGQVLEKGLVVRMWK